MQPIIAYNRDGNPSQKRAQWYASRPKHAPQFDNFNTRHP